MSSSRHRPITRQTTQQRFILQRKHSVQHRYVHVLYQQPTAEQLEPFPDTSCVDCDNPGSPDKSFIRIVRRIKQYDPDVSISGYNYDCFIWYRNNRPQTIKYFQEFLESLTFHKIPADFNALARYAKNSEGNPADITEVEPATDDQRTQWQNEVNDYLFQKVVDQTSQYLVQSPRHKLPKTPAAKTFSPLTQAIQEGDEQLDNLPDIITDFLDKYSKPGGSQSPETFKQLNRV